MSLLSKIADRLILRPTTHPVDPGNNRRELVFSSGEIEMEAWVSTWKDFAASPPENRLLVLKFPGTSGRAERASVHPCELIVRDQQPADFAAAEIWTLNHRGYGGSTGPASISNFVETLERFWKFIQARFPQERKLLVGNSLGCISAFYLARHKPVDAVLVRNPPSLRRLISDRPRYNWWNFSTAFVLAREIPLELESLANAGLCDSPALMVSSEKDSVVPIEYQREILEAWAGEIKNFVIEEADHDDIVPEHQQADYIAAIDWLGEKLQAT